jgi:hypothetical protein
MYPAVKGQTATLQPWETWDYNWAHFGTFRQWSHWYYWYPYNDPNYTGESNRAGTVVHGIPEMPRAQGICTHSRPFSDEINDILLQGMATSLVPSASQQLSAAVCNVALVTSARAPMPTHLPMLVFVSPTAATASRSATLTPATAVWTIHAVSVVCVPADLCSVPVHHATI